MIFNKDFKCPYCGKDNNIEKIKEYLEDAYFSDKLHDKKEVPCEYCKKKFEIKSEVKIEISPDVFMII